MVPMIVEQHYLTLLVPFILLLFFLHKWFYTKSSHTKNLPSSPPKLPILGNLHQIGRYPHRTFNNLSKRYGELMLFHLGQTPFLVVSSVNLAREILKTHDMIFANRPHFKTTKKLFYDGKDIATSPYGDYWRQMKSICAMELLSNTRVASFRGVREEETALLMEKIRNSIGLPINLSELLSKYTKNVICRVAFGRKYNTGLEGDIDFSKLWAEFSQLVGSFRVGNFIPCLGWINRIDGWDAKVERTVREFDQFLEKVLKEHQDNLWNKKDEDSKDFVDVLLRVQQEQTDGLPIGRDNIKALMLDMLIGGMDTTVTLIEWVMAELLRNPHVMEELKKEVKEIVGLKPEVNEDDLEQMKYLKAIIKETIRLHPTLVLLGRLSSQDVKIGNYDIPVGTSILINTWAFQRDPAYWQDPNKFEPKRFLNSSISLYGQSIELIPFGSGRRMCPGMPFAFKINELALSNLVHNFDWVVPGEIEDKALDMAESGGVMMRKKTPVIAIPNAYTVM